MGMRGEHGAPSACGLSARSRHWRRSLRACVCRRCPAAGLGDGSHPQTPLRASVALVRLCPAWGRAVPFAKDEITPWESNEAVEAQAAAIGDVPWGGASPGQGGSPGFARGDEAGNQPCRGQCRERGPCPARPPQVSADNVTGSQFISVTFQFISGSVPKTPVGKFRKRGSARGKRNVLDLEPVAEKPALFTDDLVPAATRPPKVEALPGR